MILEKLELTDFMKAENVSMVFEDKSFIILQGANGAGKSLIGDALELMLLGAKRGSSYKHYIRRGCNKFIVKAVFRKNLQDTDKFEVEIVGGKKTMPPLSKRVTYKGLTHENSEYDAFMSTQFNQTLLSTFTFNTQGAKDLSHYKPSQLRDLLVIVFNLSFDSEQSRIENDLSVLKDKLSSTEITIASRKEAISILEDSSSVPIRPPSEERIKKCSKLLDEIRSQKKALEKREAELKYKNNLNENRTHLLQLLEGYELRISEKECEKTSLENDIMDLKNSLLLTQENIKTKNSERPYLNKDEKLQEDVLETKKLQENIYKINDQLKLISKGKCDECGTVLVKSPADKQHKIATLKASLKDLEECLLLLNNYSNTESTILSEIKKLKYKESDIEGQLQQKEASLKTVETFLKELNASEDRNTYSNKLKEVEKELSGLHIEDVENILKKLTEVEEEEAKRALDLEVLMDVKKEFETRRKVLKETHSKLTQAKKELVQGQIDLTEITRQYDIHKVAYKLVSKYLPSFGVMLAGEQAIESMLKIIHPLFPEWCLRLVPNREGVSFEYKEKGDEWSPLSMASGFEKALCTIAFKLTLSSFYKMSLLFLDEIDAAACEENSKKLFELVIDYHEESDSLQQVILASHLRNVVNDIKESSEYAKVYEVIEGRYRLKD